MFKDRDLYLYFFLLYGMLTYILPCACLVSSMKIRGLYKTLIYVPFNMVT